MLSKAVLFSALVATVSSQALEDVLAEHDDRSLFVEYATGAGLVDEIAGLDAATIFAPTNEAFESILEDLPDLVNDDDDDSLTERLTNILMYHVIGSGTYVSSDISDFPGDFLPTLLDDMTVNPYVGEVAAVFSAEKRRSSITTPDLDYDNGVVHIIDKVMLPPNPPNATALDMGFLYFAGALQQLDLVADINTADQVTLFIPSDEAFTAVGSALQDFSTEELDALVKYHVVVGQAATTKDLSDGDSFETLADGNSVDIAANADDGVRSLSNISL